MQCDIRRREMAYELIEAMQTNVKMNTGIVRKLEIDQTGTEYS